MYEFCTAEPKKNRFDSPFSPFRACRSAPGALLQRVSSGFVPRFVRFWSGVGARGSGPLVAWFRGRGAPVAAVPGPACRSRLSGPGVRLRHRTGLSIEALRSRRVGRRVPGPQRSGYSFSVWGSSLTETSRVLFSRSACGRGLLVHSSQSRRRCVMSMAA